MTKSILHAISEKPDDQAEWCNILQLMYHLRQALACSLCGKLVSEPYTPVQEPCHCICSSCRNENTQSRHNCVTCRNALENNSQYGFELNTTLNFTASGFVALCKLLVAKDMLHKWSNLQVSTQNGPITFEQLIQEGYSSDSKANGQNLSEKFRKRVKKKEHRCRCGSGAKRNKSETEGQALGCMTCLNQRCACYKESKCLNSTSFRSNSFDFSPLYKLSF